MDLGPYGGTDPLGIFPLCLKKTDAMVRRVRPIPKGPLSSTVAYYRLISITSVFSKMVERLVIVRLKRFMERSGVLPTTLFDYRKGLGTCHALLCMSHTLEGTLKSGKETGSCRLISG